jgi:hypothetical protein
MSKKTSIEVQGTAIAIVSRDEGDYISLTDMVRNFEGGGALIEQWLKNKDTVLFLGVWEKLHNPDFNSLEFEGIRNEAGRNSFFLSAKKIHMSPPQSERLSRLNQIAIRQMLTLTSHPALRQLPPGTGDAP